MVSISNRVPETILSDLKRLKQVLFNLIGNAVKFTFKGHVGIAVDYDINTNEIQIDVTDSGVGIKEEDLCLLFKFFGCLSRSKDINKGGMGLGLTISKMIIQQLGGSIDVTSTYNEGSKFSFRLPTNSPE